MRVFQVIFGVFVVLSSGASFNVKRDHKYDQLIRSWNSFLNKLQIPGQSLDFFQGSLQDQSPIFDELEALLLIPALIELQRKDLLLDSEKRLLSEVYGNIWSMIVEEATRDPAAQMNPLLKSIFDLIQFLKSHESIYTSDIIRNTVESIPRPGFRRLDIQKQEEDRPSQRVLNMAAVLIRSMRSLSSSQSQYRHHPEPRHSRFRRALCVPQAHFNLELTNIPITEISRSVRAARKTSYSSDLPVERIDTVLKTFLEEKGIGSRTTDRKSAVEDDSMDDYADLDDMQNDNVYDNQYEYDDHFSARRSHRQQGFENGSFQDLIMLAAKHRFSAKPHSTEDDYIY